MQDNLNHKARTYFLQQGQSITRLNNILDSNILTHYISKWFSILIEVFLYTVFIIVLASVCVAPNDISFYFNVTETTSVNMQISNVEFGTFITCIKIICIILSTPLLAFAILLGRNRKKNSLIRKAYEESLKMKEAFDTALKELSL